VRGGSWAWTALAITAVLVGCGDDDEDETSDSASVTVPDVGTGEPDVDASADVAAEAADLPTACPDDAVVSAIAGRAVALDAGQTGQDVGLGVTGELFVVADPDLSCAYDVGDGPDTWTVARQDDVAAPLDLLSATFDDMSSRCVDGRGCGSTLTLVPCGPGVTECDDSTVDLARVDVGDGGLVFRHVWDTSRQPFPAGYLAVGWTVVVQGGSVCTAKVSVDSFPTIEAAQAEVGQATLLAASTCGVATE
jgi:hypothetical protein